MDNFDTMSIIIKRIYIVYLCKKLNKEQIKLIEKMYEEKAEQRKIARILGVHLGTVQHHLKKN
jgi:hypothetical protein